MQRRASRWILRTRKHDSSYKERLILLDLLPLSLDRELKDLIFFYKCLYCSTDLDVQNYVSFVSHDRTRLSNSFNLPTPFCKKKPFRPRTLTVLLNYGTVCKLAPSTSFSSPTAFQLFVRKLMSTHLSRVYEINYPPRTKLAALYSATKSLQNSCTAKLQLFSSLLEAKQQLHSSCSGMQKRCAAFEGSLKLSAAVLQRSCRLSNVAK